MNEPHQKDQHMEALLQGLPLRRPSDVLDERVRRTLTPSHGVLWKLAAAACFGGLCFVLGFGAGRGGTPTEPTTPAQHETASEPKATPADPNGPVLAAGVTRIDQQWPVAQAQVLYDVDAGPPIRATIQDTIERTRWVDPKNNSDIELTRPVREISFSLDTPY